MIPAVSVGEIINPAIRHEMFKIIWLIYIAVKCN